MDYGFDFHYSIYCRWSHLCHWTVVVRCGKTNPCTYVCILVVAGSVLDGFGLYEPFIDFAGAGATIPITSFGNALTHGAMAEAEKHGLIGVLTGMFEVTSSGISAAILFGFIASFIFKSKGQSSLIDHLRPLPSSSCPA